MQRRGFLGGLAAAWGAAAAAPRESGALVSGASAPGALVLGQSAALTGPAAALGQQFKQGAELFFQRWNAARWLSVMVGARTCSTRDMNFWRNAPRSPERPPPPMKLDWSLSARISLPN